MLHLDISARFVWTFIEIGPLIFLGKAKKNYICKRYINEVMTSEQTEIEEISLITAALVNENWICERISLILVMYLDKTLILFI